MESLRALRDFHWSLVVEGTKPFGCHETMFNRVYNDVKKVYTMPKIISIPVSLYLLFHTPLSVLQGCNQYNGGQGLMRVLDHRTHRCNGLVLQQATSHGQKQIAAIVGILGFLFSHRLS